QLVPACLGFCWLRNLRPRIVGRLLKLVKFTLLIMAGVLLVLFLLARARRRFFQSADLSAVNPKTAVVSAGHSSQCSGDGWRLQAVRRRDPSRQPMQRSLPDTRS